jgi:hypothetical protein
VDGEIIGLTSLASAPLHNGTTMIHEFLARVWEMLIGRVHGPFTFRPDPPARGGGLIAMLAGVSASVFNRVCFNYPTLGDLYKYATYEALLKRDELLPGDNR